MHLHSQTLISDCHCTINRWRCLVIFGIFNNQVSPPSMSSPLHEAHSVWWLCWWCLLGFQHSLADVSFFLRCTWTYKNLKKNADGEQFTIESSVYCHSLTSLWFSVWFPNADPVPCKKDKNYVPFFIRASLHIFFGPLLVLSLLHEENYQLGVVFSLSIALGVLWVPSLALCHCPCLVMLHSPPPPPPPPPQSIKSSTWAAHSCFWEGFKGGMKPPEGLWWLGSLCALLENTKCDYKQAKQWEHKAAVPKNSKHASEPKPSDLSIEMISVLSEVAFQASLFFGRPMGWLCKV